MHVRLVPSYTLHQDEHLTLVWCGKKNGDEFSALVSSYAQLVDAALMHEPLRLTIKGHGILSSSHVSFLDPDPRLAEFRAFGERLGLNKSTYPSWLPHITAPGTKYLREIGSSVTFRRAQAV